MHYQFYTLNKKSAKKTKFDLHPRNKHRSSYDFKLLINCCPELATYVFINKYKTETIDFSDPEAVKLLNKALLLSNYKVQSWDLPEGFLTPPIPGRADYIHYLADLLAESNKGIIPTGNEISCLDIGVGASCIYPLIAASEYEWLITGSDSEEKAVASAQKIIDSNPHLKNLIKLKHQSNTRNIFEGIIEKDEYYDISICNPPFHSSREEANAGSMRKLKNLRKGQKTELKLNFGGLSNELWYDGGELAFISTMILESKYYASNVLWFTSLVSKESNLASIKRLLQSVNVHDHKVIEMNTGNKKTRFVVWTFFNEVEQSNWAKKRWK